MRSVEEHREWANVVVQRLLADPAFREELRDNPSRTLGAAGFEYGDTSTVQSLPTFEMVKVKCTQTDKCTRTCGYKSCTFTCTKSCLRTEKAARQ